MTQRPMNFSAGPSAFPQTVLAKAEDALRDTEGRGLSILEWSHRGRDYAEVHARTEVRLRRLLGLEGRSEWALLFLQGGASLQFAEVPMNLASANRPGAYVVTGVWGSKALAEAERLGRGRALWSGKGEGFRRLPSAEELPDPGDAAYLHITSNNTIAGTQWPQIPRAGDLGVVVDASSDILSRPMDLEGLDLVFAGAQKNLGPAGLSLVALRKEALDQREGLPAILDYRAHLAAGGIFNTPPTFAVWLMGEVLRWIEEEGGVAEMSRRSQAKAELLYGAIDGGEFYEGSADPGSRSLMNVCFRLPSPELESLFLSESEKAGFVGLRGHRSVGGVRASLYNAVPEAWVLELVRFMRGFEERHG